MPLMQAVLKKALSQESLRRFASPPPEIDEEVIMSTRKRRPYKYAHIQARVDTSPPWLDPRATFRSLPGWRDCVANIYAENMRLVMLIKKTHFMRGRVDSHWNSQPQPVLQHYHNRVDFFKRTQRNNKEFYKRLINTNARVATAKSLRQDWERNKREILSRAECEFVLFPPVPVEVMEHIGFAAPSGVHRPRAHITLQVRNGAVIGELTIELFSEVAPRTCQLFLELLDGDQTGHGYVGTRFFRKVPNVYWSGGDVIYDNGFGCYAQEGCVVPIGAENYHFSHCMPGLLSMRVTRDDEMCGIFSMTFKPLPQLDLKSVVFGRVIRPSSTYDIICGLGSALSSQPIVEISATRRRPDASCRDRWVCGKPNARLLKRTVSWIRRRIVNETNGQIG